ncbi:hypothetical protein E2C01_070890 [Portunus trituberculatus]|uniref:Uncharacterized protein n=1 Tax=Portunus trituberculatus TaxID=210409 RepID=A0A5B7I4U3_PORTR|nr:hypothetical protein [Portunus trituberculatus]
MRRTTEGGGTLYHQRNHRRTVWGLLPVCRAIERIESPADHSHRKVSRSHRQVSPRYTNIILTRQQQQLMLSY